MQAGSNGSSSTHSDGDLRPNNASLVNLSLRFNQSKTQGLTI